MPPTARHDFLILSTNLKVLRGPPSKRTSLTTKWPGRTPSSKASFFLPVPGDLHAVACGSCGTNSKAILSQGYHQLRRRCIQGASHDCWIQTANLHLHHLSLQSFPVRGSKHPEVVRQKSRFRIHHARVNHPAQEVPHSSGLGLLLRAIG